MRLEQRGRLAHEDWIALEAGEDDPFGVDDARTEWRRKDHYTVLLDGERPIAATGLATVVAEVADHAFEVVGVGGVIVTRSHRGRGHLRPVLQAALERAATLGPDVAMMFCSPAKIALYERFGFAVITAPVTVDQPSGEHVMLPHAMWRPLRDGATWPPGPVRVRGLPF